MTPVVSKERINEVVDQVTKEMNRPVSESIKVETLPGGAVKITHGTKTEVRKIHDFPEYSKKDGD